MPRIALKLCPRAAVPGALFFSAIFACMSASCAPQGSKAAILWTDRAEFVLYAEHFNGFQDRYKVESCYVEFPARELTQTNEHPDIVAGSYIKSASTRLLFRPLDDLFKKGILSEAAFYPRLLALGNIEGKQYLLPISFNIPTLVFARDTGPSLSNPFTISLEEIQEKAGAYNSETPSGFSRLGFSPLEDEEFLFILASLFNTSFREAEPLAWNAAALEEAMTYAEAWVSGINKGIQAEEDFIFKYFYDPSPKLIGAGRILFAYMDSSRFFTLSEDSRTPLDFRWIARENVIPLDEDSVYYGIYKKGRASKASQAFTEWFFQAETQRLLLETGKNRRIDETLFGIGGGFSAMRNVTEQIFPQFYPGLLGRMPPEDFLSPPNILPRNWKMVKEKVILPYLRERIRRQNREDFRSLERRVNDWYRLNRD